MIDSGWIAIAERHCHLNSISEVPIGTIDCAWTFELFDYCRIWCAYCYSIRSSTSDKEVQSGQPEAVLLVWLCNIIFLCIPFAVVYLSCSNTSENVSYQSSLLLVRATARIPRSNRVNIPGISHFR